MSSVLLFARHHPGLAPAEVVKVPEGIDGEDKVPNGEREEVDEHPRDVNDLSGRQDDEQRGETEDGREEEERDSV